MASFGDFNRVQTNVGSLDAQLSLNKINRKLGDSRLKLSTGLKINSSEDNPAGYATATKLNSRLKGLEKSLINVGEAKSMLDVVENAYSNIIDNLIKMKTLATQAASETIDSGSSEMSYIVAQMNALANEINEIADSTEFNGNSLIGSGQDETFNIQIGEGDSDPFKIALSEISLKTIFPENSLLHSNGLQWFSEDFDNADISQFNLEDGTVGNAIIESGSHDGSNMLTVTNPGTGIGPNVYPTSFKEGYGIYSVKVKSNTYSANTSIRIMDTDSNVNEGIGFGVRPINSDDPGADLSVLIDGVSVEDSFTNNVNWGDWFEMKVEVSKETVKGYINGVQVAETISSPDLESGRFKLGAYGSVSYDDMSFMPDMRNLMDDIDSALENMNSKMVELGVNQRALSSREENLSQSIVAHSAARSRIMDTDFAKEQSNAIRLQILQQTSIAALSQANLGPQAVLSFLG